VVLKPEENILCRSPQLDLIAILINLCHLFQSTCVSYFKELWDQATNCLSSCASILSLRRL
jgi:hypothetical protein